MENFTQIIQFLMLIVAALGGFRQYILKPYFDHRDEERKWREQLEKMKEQKEIEKDRRDDERAEILCDKYSQLADSITKLSTMVKSISEEQHQIHVQEVRVSEKIDTHERRIDNLETGFESIRKKLYNE